MRIFLVRHGESEGNVDKEVYQTVADHAVALTERGRAQARGAGDFLQGYLKGHPTFPLQSKPRMWTSPYLRAIQTADEICERLGKDVLKDRRENIRLREQEFGLLNGIAGQSVGDHFPHVDENYKRFKRYGGKFYAKNPCGESRADVCDRVHMFSGTIKRDLEKHHISDVIVVCHGTTLRAFVMEWMHYDVEWFENQPNPPNCAVWLLQKVRNATQDMGLIYGGQNA